MRALIVSAVLTLSACGGSVSYDENAEIPADAWPALDGVTVIASNGFIGADCCETEQTGGRYIKLKTSVATSEAVDFVASGLSDAGWQTYRCGETVCRRHDDMVAVLSKPDAAERKRGVEVFVEFVRESAPPN